jgi:hypothetical protein
MSNFCSHCGKPVVQNADFCTQCGGSLRGKKPARTEWQSKRGKVLDSRGVGGLGRWKIPVIVGILGAMSILVISNLPKSGNPVLRAQPVAAEGVSYPRVGQPMLNISAKIENGKIVIPLDIVREKKFVAFAYNGPKGAVPLLAYLSTEGRIVTAVSMCEPCNSQRFHISGNELICNSCGTKWKIDTLEPISGSCGKYPPDPIPSLVDGNEVRIDEQIVANWQRRI